MKIPHQTKKLLHSAACFAMLLCFFSCNKLENKLAALPESASIALEINNLANFDSIFMKHPSGMVQAVQHMVFFKKLKTDLDLLWKILPDQNLSLAQQLKHSNLLCGVSLSAAESQRAVFIFELNEPLDLLQNLKKIDSSKVKVLPSIFQGNTIYTLHLTDNQRVAFAQHQNLLLFSAVPYLVEESLAALKKGKNGWENAPTDCSSPARMMLHLSKMNAQLEHQFLTKFRHLPRWIAQNMSFVEFQIFEKSLSLHGHPQHFLDKIWKTGTAPREDFFAVLPNHTTHFFWTAAANRQPFFQRQQLSESTDFQYFVGSWMADEAAFVLTQPFSNNLLEEQFLVIKTRDTQLADNRLSEFGNRFGTLRDYDYQSFRIRQFVNGKLLSPALRHENEAFNRPSCVQLGDFVVFGHSTTALEIWVDKYVVSQNLLSNTDFLQLKNQLPPIGQHLLFLNADFLKSTCERIFSPEIPLENARVLQQAGLLALDISDGKTHFFEQKDSKVLPKAGILWKTTLAAPAITRPCPVIFQPNEPPVGIFVQDEHHQLYCLQSNGEVAWRRYLDGQLISEVQCLDFYQNGSPCFLLSTPQKIYLFDVNGKDVEGYPISMRSAASSGVKLITFSESIDCAYFIACENGNAYGFDRFGRPLPGWNPQAVGGKVEHPVVHFQHLNKDYLAMLTRDGKLSVWGRDGDLRFAPLHFDGVFSTPLQVEIQGNNAPRWVASNRAGKVFCVNWQGEKFGLDAGGKTAFVFSEIAGDPRKDFAALSENQLTLKGYRTDGKFEVLFTKKYPFPQDTLFEIETGNPSNWLGSWSRSHRQIFLVNGRGYLLPDFPMAGSTPFSVAHLSGKQGGLTLLVGLDAQVFAYFLGN